MGWCMGFQMFEVLSVPPGDGHPRRSRPPTAETSRRVWRRPPGPDATGASWRYAVGTAAESRWGGTPMATWPAMVRWWRIPAVAAAGAVALGRWRARRNPPPPRRTGVSKNGMDYEVLGDGPRTLLFIPGGPGSEIPAGLMARIMIGQVLPFVRAATPSGTSPDAATCHSATPFRTWPTTTPGSSKRSWGNTWT